MIKRSALALKFVDVKRVLAFILSLSYCFFAISQSATEDFGFKEIPVSTISAAMGGNQIAGFSEDINQSFSNPGFYDSTLNQSVSLSYLNYLTNVNQTSLSYGHMIDSIGLVSGYFRYLEYGEFTETDEFGNEVGVFKSAEYELGISLTKTYSDRIFYGVTLKQFYSNLYKSFAFGLALDGGVFYIDDKGLQMGLTLDNVGAKLIDYNAGGSQTFRPSLNFGISKKFAKAPIMLSGQYNNFETWDLARTDGNSADLTSTDALTGETTRRVLTADNFARHITLSAAFVPSEKFHVMGGFNFRRRLELATSQRPGLVGFSLGTQFKIKRFEIQYALVSYNINGASNHFSISTNLSEWYSKTQVSNE